MGTFNDEEIYPNQPLSDVACEVRFKGEMQVECERYRFWDEIRDQYKDILVPHAQAGQAVALQHYKFRDPANGRTVAVALNSLVYSEATYTGHKSFISEFSRLLGIFCRVYPRVGQITRVGWRYINVMPFSRESGLVPLNRLLTFNVSLPADIFGKTATLDFMWNGKCLEGEVQIHLAVVQGRDMPAQEALLLDIDFGQLRNDIGWTGISHVIEDARRKCRMVFEGMITDEYRNYLRGEKV